MKLVKFGIDNQRKLIFQFPVFVQPYTQQHLTLYQMETVPIVDENKQAQSYTYLTVKKPYVALKSETYISLRTQELTTCKKISYEFYCEELFVVKHKTKYSCKSLIYFDLGTEIIKENCYFQHYFNSMHVKPAICDQGHEIVLANWPNNKHVFCNDNNNLPIKIWSHPYVLINRTDLCNCGIEAEDNFLLESIAGYPGKQSDLIMHFTVNTVFMHYFYSLTNKLETHILQNWTMHEQVLPISLQTFNFDPKLLEAQKTLKDFVYQYQQKKQILDKGENTDNSKHSFFDNYKMDVFLFITTILSVIATAAILHIVCKHAKLKANKRNRYYIW